MDNSYLAWQARERARAAADRLVMQAFDTGLLVTTFTAVALLTLLLIGAL